MKKIVKTVEHDKVNKPSHYQGKSLQVIDVIEDFNLGFRLGNAIKYILRVGRKDYGDGENAWLDLQKAIWYIQREIEKMANE